MTSRIAMIGRTETSRLGTSPPCRGTGGRRGQSSNRIAAGKCLADLDQADPQPLSKVSEQAYRSIFVLIEPGAGPALIGKVRDVVVNVGGELPGAAVHGGLLHGLRLLIDRAASPGRVISSYVLVMESAASSRRSASSTSISPRSTASRTARRAASPCALD